MQMSTPKEKTEEKIFVHEVKSEHEDSNDLKDLKEDALMWEDINQKSKKATEMEHNMSLLEGLRTYPKAVGWSLVVSTAIIMEGYDTALLGSFYAYPSFQEKYGESVAGGGFAVSAKWQTALGMSTNIGVLIGVFINGFLTERFGYKRMMLYSLVAISGCIFVPFFSPNAAVLFVGELLCGIPWGVFSTMAPAYASEVCPVVLRGYLTTYVNLCWVIGQLIAAGVLDSLQSRTDEWSYRIPFALQWMWPLPLFVAICFAPESPWWLIRRGRIEDATRSLKRLSNKNVLVDKVIAMMVKTNHYEKEISEGTTYLDCFKGSNLRRTEICCMVWSIQNLSGSPVMGYATYFFLQAGLATSNAFAMNVSQYAIGFLGTILSWFLINRFGRRTIYLTGLIICDILMFLIGFLSLAPQSNTSIPWATSGVLLAFVFAYDISIGPVCYALVSEISSTRLRGKSIGLARNSYNILSICFGAATPYMLNPDALNWKGKVGFFWGCVSFCCVLWTYFRLPEPKGRTFEELDIMFEHNIPARQFKNYKIEE
ncbi:general substrate transporter [Umbelopsis sp. PMI_123]|nr:general substrate transporter [Umbelopsis sp. PMI_123]